LTGQPEIAKQGSNPEDVAHLLRDLQIHKAELEAQNEDLRRTQIELVASRARYFDLYDLAPVGYLTLSPEGLILEANLAAANMLGVERYRLVKQLMASFILPEDQYAHSLHQNDLFHTGEKQVYEVRLKTREETPRWALIEADAGKLGNEEADVCRVAISDITERKRGEELSRSQRDLAQILSITTSLDAALRLCLSTAIRVAGMDAGGIYLVDETSGDFDVVVDAGLSPAFASSIAHYPANSAGARLVQAGLPIYTRHQEIGVSLDDVRRRENLRASAVIPVLHEKKAIACLNLASHTLDELPLFARHALETIAAQIGGTIVRLRVEEALRKSEEKYRSLIENGHDIIYALTADGVFTFVSPAWTRLLGHSIADVAGQPFQRFVHPDDLPGCMVFLKSVIETGQRQAGVEYRVRHTDGTWHWHTSSAVPFKDEAGEIVGFYGIARDITDRKQLEERIRQVRGDLLFAVSHDLKSPLQALHQSQEMLSSLQPGESLARFQEYSEIWRRNLQRLERMINNLVDSQRGEEGRFPLLLAPCDPVELVKRVAEDLTGSALSFQATFDLTLQPVPEGSCDEEALARVVENLLTNAVKFSQGGGRVEVRLEMEENILLLEVEDHGLGIPADEQAHLFQPFQRGDSAQQRRIPGTGLGLYVCRRIVEEHGGTITLISEEGKGTVVTVRLPWGGKAEL